MVTTGNQPITGLDTYLIVGSGRCVVLMLDRSLNDAFPSHSLWQNFQDILNQVTIIFNQHPKAHMLLRKEQLHSCVAQDHVETLKHDVTTVWNSRLAAMETFLSLHNVIASVAT